MSNPLIEEMGTLLTPRKAYSGSEEGRLPQGQWDTEVKAAIVILWGMLIYPQLDPELKANRRRWIEMDPFEQMYKDFLDEPSAYESILEILVEQDYIRMGINHYMTAGTRLYAAVDAMKMYQCYRSSVLVKRVSTDLNE